jgi:hypothetical protein
MDLTASLQTFKESGRVFKIFKYGQLVNFETPVFKETLKVYSISGGVTTVLVEGTDFTVPQDCITACDNDVSRAKIEDQEFDKVLISGIQMIKGVDDEGYTISVDYQKLYPNEVRTAYLHNEPLNITPELMLGLVRAVEDLTVRSNSVNNSTTLIDPVSVVYELDVDKSNINNYVEEEVHDIDVGNGRYVILPKGGSFYGDSVTVYYPKIGTTLVEGSDYYLAGQNEAKLKVTSHKSNVFDFIVITSPISGEVKISYHAFGGEPTVDNYNDLLKYYQNLVQYCKSNLGLTATTLGSTKVMTAVFDRITALETSMRRLLGTPSYGDITTGKSVLMKLFTDQPGMHWYTIASLYTANGENMQPTDSDTFVFRLQSKLSKFQFTAAVAVNLNNEENDRMSVTVLSENFNRGYVPFTDYADVNKIIRPQLRVVWNQSSVLTGAYLQLGFTLTNMLEETICIEDMSGHESVWKLPDEVATVTYPQDSDFTLPNGTSVWSDSLSTSKSESILIPFQKGHLAWCGSIPLNRPDDGWQYVDISDELLLEDSVNISRISKLRLDIEEQEGFQFPVDICFNSRTSILKGHATFTHGDKPAYINAEIYRLDDGKLNIRLNFDITAGNTSNELDIKDIVIYMS